MTSYCVNPNCQNRKNPLEEDQCLACDSNLILQDRYRLTRLLKESEAWRPIEVFEVVDINEEGSKILKILDSRGDANLVRDFKREAISLSRISHPRIPEREGFFSVTIGDRELHCMVLQKMEGVTLTEWIQNNRKISQQLAIQWLESLMEMVACIHNQNYLHRDVNPNNIIVTPDQNLSLIDFSGARPFSTETYHAKITRHSGDSINAAEHERTITVLGTPGYASPEQRDGRALPQSDFFGVARTLIYALTGHSPRDFPEDPKTGKLDWHRFAPGISPAFKNYIDILGSPMVGNRPQTAEIILQYVRHRYRLPLLLKVDLVRHSLFKTLWGRLLLLVLLTGGAICGYQVLRNQQTLSLLVEAKDAQLDRKLDLAWLKYKEVLEANPGNDLKATVHNNLGVIFVAQGNDRRALTEYQTAIDLNPEYWEAFHNLAVLHDRLGSWRLAEQYYREAGKGGGDMEARSLAGLSRMALLRKDYQAAIALATTAKEKALKIPKLERSVLGGIFKNLGWAAFEQKRFTEAEQALQEAVDRDPTRREVYCFKAEMADQRQDKQAAAFAWDRCKKADPTLPEVQFLLEQHVRRDRQALHKSDFGT